MESSFLLALVLSAIDGLLCAFVAMLLMAVVLIGRGNESAPSPVRNSISILVVKKSNLRTTSKEMATLLVVDISIDGGEYVDEAVGAIGQAKELEKLKGAMDSGHVFWSDCVDESRSTCAARLIIVNPRTASKWRVRLREANIEGDFFLDPSADLMLDVYQLGKEEEGLRPTKLAIGRQFVFCPDWDRRLLDSGCI